MCQYLCAALKSQTNPQIRAGGNRNIKPGRRKYGVKTKTKSWKKYSLQSDAKFNYFFARTKNEKPGENEKTELGICKIMAKNRQPRIS